MRSSLLARLGGLAAVLLLVASASQASAGGGAIGGSTVWTMVGAPSMSTQLGNPVATTMFSNHANVTITGVVIMVIHNSLGQTVAFPAGTTSPAPGGISPAEDVVAGLQPGTYTATFFALTIGWVPLSNSTTITFTLPLS